MLEQIERRPIRSAAAHDGHVLANGGPGGEIAPGVAPWSRAWLNPALVTLRAQGLCELFLEHYLDRFQDPEANQRLDRLP